MLFRILKKDLRRKKTMNAILFLFIVLATMFLASSVKNMKSILQSIDYFTKITSTSDYFDITMDQEAMKEFLQESSIVEDYSVCPMYPIDGKTFYSNGKQYDQYPMIMLTSLDDKYNKVLDQENHVIDSIKEDEIVICHQVASDCNLKIGDTIRLATGEVEREYKIANLCKDMVFGSNYVQCKRFFIHQNEIEEIRNSTSSQPAYFFSVLTKDSSQLTKEVTNAGLETAFRFDYATLCTVFTMDLMVMAIIIIISIILIAIAFVVLRFTILFTVHEEYKEIGIMKAVGLRVKSIKKIYLIKYTSLAIVGAVIGVLASFPFSRLLVRDIEKNIALESGTSTVWIHLLCGVAVIVVIDLYCRLCTNRVRKISAMQAIRSGESGERYTKKSPIALHKTKKLSVRHYLAMNDILSSPKRYLSMVITFALGFIMVILIDNAATTLADASIIRQMGYQMSDVAFDNGKLADLVGESQEKVQEQLDELQVYYQSKGIPIELFQEYIIQVMATSENTIDGVSVNAYGIINTDRSGYSYLKGIAPELPNECAVTDNTMEKLGVEIGDTIELSANGVKNHYIITASYESMLDGGTGIRLAKDALTGRNNISRLNEYQGNFPEGMDVEEMIQKMRTVTPDYKIRNAKEFAHAQLGSVVDTLKSVKMMLLTITICIHILVAVLMVKTLFTKERSSLALMMSLGFSVRSLRRYHTLRITIVVLAAMVIGIIASILQERPMVILTFGMMGARQIELVREPWRVYLVYPIILVFVTTVAAYLSTRGIRHVKFNEINHQE